MKSPYAATLPKRRLLNKRDVNIEASLPQLRRFCDDIFSKWIRRRVTVNGLAECFTCGLRARAATMECSHYIDRDVMALRFDEINCQCMCVVCNDYHNSDPTPYRNKLVEKYGEKAVLELESQEHSITKLSRIELLELIEKYSK